MISYKNLLLDNEKNPRLPKKLEGASIEKIIEYMVRDANVINLIESIGEKDFFQGEPLLAVEAKEQENCYTVVEGNRRLTAVMILHDPAQSPIFKDALSKAVRDAVYKPEELPVVVYNERSDILDYLGYRHITGTKAWDPLAKAKYLKQLYEKSGKGTPTDKCRELARIIGSKSNYVEKLLRALKIYEIIQDEGFYDIRGLEDELHFSFITTALGFEDIVSFLEMDESIDLLNIADGFVNKERLKELTEWMFKKENNITRIIESRNISKLAKVVADDNALAEFRKGTPLDDAYWLTNGPERLVETAIEEADYKIDLAYRYSKNVKKLGDMYISKLDNIMNAAEKLRNYFTI